uniref:transcription factor BTF3-like n=1 Tax=Halichoerus grypus TaxID=9711 RepID=UPI001659E145
LGDYRLGLTKKSKINPIGQKSPSDAVDLEVNTFTNQGTVIDFHNLIVQASLAVNTFIIPGHADTEQLTEMLPSILNQLGTDSLPRLRRLAKAPPTQSVDGKAPLATRGDDDDEVSDFVENFDEASKNEAN